MIGRDARSPFVFLEVPTPLHFADSLLVPAIGFDVRSSARSRKYQFWRRALSAPKPSMPRKKLPPVEIPYVNGVPLCLLQSDHMTFSAVRIYGALVYRMDKKSRKCWASMTTLGETVGIRSRGTVWEALQVLETLRLIKRVKTRPGSTTVYEVRRPKRKHEQLIHGLRGSIGGAVRNAEDPKRSVLGSVGVDARPRITAAQKRRVRDKQRKAYKADTDIRNSAEYRDREYRDLEGIPDDD